MRGGVRTVAVAAGAANDVERFVKESHQSLPFGLFVRSPRNCGLSLALLQTTILLFARIREWSAQVEGDPIFWIAKKECAQSGLCPAGR